MAARVRLALLLVVTVASISASPQEPPENDQDPVAEAIAAYNRAPEVTSLFKLYGADPETRLDISTGSGQLQFKIKETKCPKQSVTQSMKKCAFKKSGVVKECTATTSLGDNTLTVSCDTIIQKTRVRRPRQAKGCTTKNKKQGCKGKTTKPRPGGYGPLSPDNV